MDKVCTIEDCNNKYKAKGLCQKHYSREHFSRNKSAYRTNHAEYIKTPGGHIVKMYDSARYRVKGLRGKDIYWKNKDILSKEAFKSWIMSEPIYSNYLKLFVEWQDSSFNHLLTPSINRINSEEGYIVGNIEIITHQENSRLSGIQRKPSSASGYKGVWKVGKKFRASIKFDNIDYNLGYFDKPEEAAIAYNKKALEFFGERAYLNKVLENL